MANQYEELSKGQLVALLEKRDRQRKLGLVWERNEIEADRAVDTSFVAASICHELSERPAPWGNLVIEGDNFDALRWLRMTLAGRIKCIYVDPPYNTGNRDWVYNDHYIDKHDRFRHSTWLEFLHRRFALARDLLTEDGVILVSINDENRALLELMLDETLPGMKAGSLTWRSRTGGNEGGSAFLSTNHEHVLVAAVRDVCERLGWRFRVLGRLQLFEPHIVYANIDLIQSRRMVQFDQVHAYQAMELLERGAGETTLGDLSEVLGGEPRGLAIAQAMMVRRLIAIDLNGLLTAESRVAAITSRSFAGRAVR